MHCKLYTATAIDNTSMDYLGFLGLGKKIDKQQEDDIRK